MHKYKIFGFFLPLTFLCLWFCACPPPAADAAPKTVRVGYFLWDGYHNISPTGYRSGYGYEYLHEIAKYTGWQYEYVEASWAQCQQLLAEGKIDLLTSMYYGEENAKRFDFSSLPIGTNYSVLIGSMDAPALSEDAAAMGELRVGILRGDSRAALINQFSAAHKFTYVPVYLSTEKDLEDALATNKIDVILSDGLRRIHNEMIVRRFAPLPFYCVVKKGDTALLTELNAALETLKTDNPQIDTQLYNKYYTQSVSKTAMLTEKEKAYFQEKKVITAVAAPGRNPLSFFENGEYQGIVADIMKKIAEDLGVEIRYIETATYHEAIQKVKSGEAEILCNFFTDYDWAEKNSLTITAPYLEMQYSAIMLQGNQTSNPTIATADNYFLNQAMFKKQYHLNSFTAPADDNHFFNQMFLEGSFTVENLFHYKTEEDCLKAVKSGTQDMTFLNAYVAEKLLRSNKYNGLTAFLIPNFRHGISVAFSPAADPLLRSGLNKSVLHLNKNITASIVARHTMFQNTSSALLDLLYRNPLAAILLIAALFSLIILALLYILNVRKKYMQNMYELAYFDSFTNLWNAAKFEMEAQKILLADKTAQYAVISVDINRFDIINESYGRNIGDQIILFAAKTLRALSVTCARVKADHFLLLFPFQEKDAVHQLTARIAGQLNRYDKNGLHIVLKPNIGIYLLPPGSDATITTSIDAAETARKEAKNKKDSIVYFSSIEKRLIKEKEIEDSMLQALKEREFQVYYQPKYDMRTHTVVGAEALIRWFDKTRGLLPPDEFIPIFERNGFIIEIDFFVLEETCKLIADWIACGQKPLQISVNQSRIHLHEENYMRRLTAVLEKYHIPKGIIELELTETAIVDDAKAPEILEKLRRLGFLLSIDDFGSGYSSLTLLNALPFDVMKIDKALLARADTSARTRKIIQKIVEMGIALNMQVICEGVEEENQANFLLSIGCFNAQGYLYSKPLPQDDFLALIKNQRA